MKKSLETKLNELNVTVEEMDAFTWVSGDTRDNVSVEAIEAYFFIGRFMVKLDKNHTQSIAKAIRNQYLIGHGMPLTRNESSACKRMAEKYQSVIEIKEAWKKTNSKSINAARMYSILTKKAADEKDIDDKIKDRIKMVPNGSTSACKMIKEGESNEELTFNDSLSHLQHLESELMKNLSMVRELIKIRKKDDKYKVMVKEVIDKENEIVDAVLNAA